MVRIFTFVFCTLAIPTLLVWGYSLWNRGGRKELPHWRNGMGLAAITLIFAGWSIQLLGLVLSLSRINSQGFQNFGWYWGYIEIYTLLLAPLLALAWKGPPRLQIFAAGVFLYLLAASSVYA